jgi:mRNA interferase MazF
MLHGASKGDVWLVDLPEGVGHEQKGKRPAVVIVHIKQNSVVVVIPITGGLANDRFSYTHCIEPSMENGLSDESVALVFQIRALDPQRFIQRKGKLGKKDMDEIDSLLLDMLQLKK